MKLVSYYVPTTDEPHSRYGVVAGERVYDLTTPRLPTLRSALSVEGVEAIAARAADTVKKTDGAPLASITLLPPIADPDKIICVGVNYATHAQETGNETPDRPAFFVRFVSSLVGHDSPTLRPRVSDQFDFEAELAVIVGRRAYQVAESDAMAYVAGYSCLAENSVRDWQRHSRQATAGKNFIKSGAFGPWLVTVDEAGPIEAMSIVGRLNGEEMQRDSAANMIFSVPRMISYLSTFTELLPGDVICTGTPAGVGHTRKPPRYLRPGDVFEVDISGVGVLSNPVSQGC
ncbi:2-keto-4-pentenoate hydratase/2-oxohepta-3-ene-1,7-dioic acid hydratase (catechol pathway) [Polaromonas sp. OV174]|uniref:fumarylacetoacetate hydrolase family protein n=1 Tax=Polaromonas sp. OV174 TaxID=1855300 RepID=UPI0008E23439|nr:fumarylacetoacetate hydrolase family protein [Polaromonas sp. OV174]SFB89894.1 2-keto-4-pentenoate hydratase/2-oxohepta-3-ene-1,7-dioic acid hydratase (catechol pathway) [Polaromonas sp. OV174]